MAKYRKKPVVIEAVAARTIIDAMTDDWEALPAWVATAYEKGVICAVTHKDFTIKTLEGDMLATLNDMLICGVKGEIYPCKLDIFTATYEPVD